jgi:RNA polymerase sigma-70 factor, ECF subfamily
MPSKSRKDLASPEQGLTEPEQWVRRYGDYLYRYAFYRLGDPAAAEELVQDTFIAALRNRGHFSGKSSERTWLIGILKHKLIDHLRRMYREKETFGQQDAEEVMAGDFDRSGSRFAVPEKWTIDPAAVIEQKEFWEILQRCLGKLPPATAQAYAMREIDGLPAEEICKVLGISTNNLWVRLHRARRALRQCLETNWLVKSSNKER